jgi:hypothetical protein
MGLRVNVPFFQPVVSDQYPLLKVIDSYLWFKDHVAVHLQPDQFTNGSHLCEEERRPTNWLATTFKIATMILSLGILPLLALLLKVCTRCCCHKFHYEIPGADMEERRPPSPARKPSPPMPMRMASAAQPMLSYSPAAARPYERVPFLPSPFSASSPYSPAAAMLADSWEPSRPSPLSSYSPVSARPYERAPFLPSLSSASSPYSPAAARPADSWGLPHAPPLSSYSPVSARPYGRAPFLPSLSSASLAYSPAASRLADGLELSRPSLLSSYSPVSARPASFAAKPALHVPPGGLSTEVDLTIDEEPVEAPALPVLEIKAVVEEDHSVEPRPVQAPGGPPVHPDDQVEKHELAVDVPWNEIVGSIADDNGGEEEPAAVEDPQIEGHADGVEADPVDVEGVAVRPEGQVPIEAPAAAPEQYSDAEVNAMIARVNQYFIAPAIQ